MKRNIQIGVISLALLIGLCGCKKETEVAYTPDVPIQQTTVQSNNSEVEQIDATEIVTEPVENNENILSFGSQTYGDSVQVNQNDLNWATYDEIPNNIELYNSYYLNNGMFVNCPEWEPIVLNDTILFTNDIVYLAITVSDKDNDIITKAMSDINTIFTTDDLSPQSVNSEEINSAYWNITQYEGGNKKAISLTLNDNDYNHCFIGIVKDDLVYDIDCAQEALIGMIKSMTPIGQDINEELPVE